MKPLFFLLPFFLTFLNCQKQFFAEYTVNCQFPRLDSDGLLLVTDYKGRELASLDLPAGTSSFSGMVSTHDDDSPDYYDLHFIYPNPKQGQADIFHQVYSKLGVKNGSLSSMVPKPLNSAINKPLFNMVQLSGIQSLGQHTSSSYPSLDFFPSFYKDSTQTLTALLFRVKGQGVLFSVIANGDPKNHQIYLSDSLLNAQETIQLDWQDLKIPSHFQEVKTPPQGGTYFLDVSAVSNDFKSFTKLWPPLNDSSALGFDRPEGLPASLNLAIKATGDNYMVEKLFKPGEAFDMKKLGINLDSWEINQTLTVQTTGSVDLVTVEAFQPVGHWSVSGSPNDFNQKQLPDLSNMIKNWSQSADFFAHGTIHAYSFDLYEYEQVQAGFPFSSNEPFANARSGYTEVWKTY